MGSVRVEGRETYQPLTPVAAPEEKLLNSRFDRRPTALTTWSGLEGATAHENGKLHAAPEPGDDVDLVQFTSTMYFCKESSGFVEIAIMRIGDCNGSCSVVLKTQDESAAHSTKYEAFDGRVTLGQGELLKTIRINIIEDDSFDTTLQFSTKLSAPMNCKLASISECRILIADDDRFPSNHVLLGKSELNADELSSMTIRLLLSFMTLTFMRVPKIWWKSAFTFCVDQLHNMFYLMRVYIQVYMVDVVLNMHNDDVLIMGDRSSTALLLGFVYMAPFFIMVVTDRTKEEQLEMTKSIRKHLQVNLFRKYLNFTEKSRRTVPVQELTFAMDGDIPMLVEDGYMFVFDLLKSLGKIVVTSYFMVRHDPSVCVVLLLFPPLALAFLFAIKVRHVALENDVIELKNESVGMVVHAVECFDLVRDYNERDWITGKYEETIQKSYKAQTDFRVFNFWSQQFVPLLTNLCLGMYIAVCAERVISGTSSPGYVLAMIQIIQELGGRFEHIFHDLERGINAGSPLVELTLMLNLDTDVLERMQRMKLRHQFLVQHLSKVQRSSVRMSAPSGPSPTEGNEHKVDAPCTRRFFDQVPFKIENVSMAFLPSFKQLMLQAEPGQLVYVTGPQGAGKSLLLRLIADIQIPEEGEILFSTHNTVLNVDTRRPLMLVDYSLYQNLTFGNSSSQVDRVRSIFNRMGLDRSPLLQAEFERNVREMGGHDHLRTTSGLAKPSIAAKESTRSMSMDMELTKVGGVEKTRAQKKQARLAGEWHSQISSGEAKRVHLARAFIANPQVLVLHRPVDDLDSGDIDMMLNTLREFVERRGLEQPTDVNLDRWRPRTCFFSGGDHDSRSEKSRSIADSVWSLAKSGVATDRGGAGKAASKVSSWVGGLWHAQHVSSNTSAGGTLSTSRSTGALDSARYHLDGDPRPGTLFGPPRGEHCWQIRSCG